MKKTLTAILRLALVIAPLVWIYSRVDAAAFARTLTSVSAPLVCAVAALFFAILTLNGLKWWMLVRRFVPDLKPGRAVAAHFESAFYAIALPSGMAQDVVKSVLLSKNHDASAVWAASWMGRLIGLFTMLAYSCFGLAHLKSGVLPDNFRTALVTSVVVMAALAVASFSKRVTRPIRSAAAKILSPAIMTKAEKFRSGIYAFKREPLALLQAFALSVAIQFLTFFYTSLIIYSVTGNFYLMECLAFAPLVELVAVALPLTPGGTGVREALSALFFTRLGVTPEQVASYATISLLMSMLRITGGIPVICKILRKGRTGS